MTVAASTAPTDAVPEELRAIKQWGVWKYEARRGKPTKVPYDARTGRKAATDNPATWCSYQEAVHALKTERNDEGTPVYDGIGFVFTEHDPFAGVDFDDCRDPDTGEIHPAALAIVDELDSYTEVSPSGKGVKVFLKGEMPGKRNRTRRTPWGGNIEVYNKERFFTVTGWHT